MSEHENECRDAEQFRHDSDGNFGRRYDTCKTIGAEQKQRSQYLNQSPSRASHRSACLKSLAANDRAFRQETGWNQFHKQTERRGRENSNREAIELVREFIQRIDAIPNVDRTKPMQLEMADNLAALRGKPDEVPTAMSVVAGARFELTTFRL